MTAEVDAPKDEWLSLAAGVVELQKKIAPKFFEHLLGRIKTKCKNVALEFDDEHCVLNLFLIETGGSFSFAAFSIDFDELSWFDLSLFEEHETRSVRAAYNAFRDEVRSALYRLVEWGDAILFARVGSPVSSFSIVPPDTFCNFNIVSWTHGNAVADDGSRLYSLHLMEAPDATDNGAGSPVSVEADVTATASGATSAKKAPPLSARREADAIIAIQRAGYLTEDAGLKALQQELNASITRQRYRELRHKAGISGERGRPKNSAAKK